MPKISETEIDRFYEGIVESVRARGVVCAITSGKACVAYGVAQATKDCDVLCVPDSAASLLDTLGRTELVRARCNYRGKISPPLDARWLRGGWTSHFFWNKDDIEAYLDVFGVAPRGSTPWEAEIRGLYASPHTVAEMKRTNRGKDWPFATALGAKLLKENDARGWLHIFDDELLLNLIDERPCPAPIIQQRPVLELVVQRDPRLRAAIHAEVQFWHELDRARIRAYDRAVRPYLVAVRKAQIPDDTDLITQHRIRVQCAEQHLPLNPLQQRGLDALVDEARKSVGELVKASSLDWLPDVRQNFYGIPL